MPKARVQIALSAVFGVALILCICVLLFGDTPNSAAIATVIAFLIGGLFFSAFLPHLDKMRIGPVSATLRDLSKRVDDHDVKQAKQRQDIKLLQFFIVNFTGKYALKHLEGLEKGERGAPYPFDCVRPEFEEELNSLRSYGLIDHFPGKGIMAMRSEGHGDLNEHFHITDLGKEYLKLRREVKNRDEADP